MKKIILKLAKIFENKGNHDKFDYLIKLAEEGNLDDFDKFQRAFGNWKTHQQMNDAAGQELPEDLTGDINQENPLDLLGAIKLFKATNQWRIPFKLFRIDPSGFWYLPVSSTALSEVMEPGQEISDRSMHGDNAPVYWIVEKIEDDKVYVKPVGSNPFAKTGDDGEIVGAGGKRIDEHDIDVLSGDYERNRLNQIKQKVLEGNPTIDDISYALMGTCPLHFGPNGAQGGWYSAKDTRNNRGGRRGMSPEEVMRKDVEIISNLGIRLPKKALSGEMGVSDWEEYVKGYHYYSGYTSASGDRRPIIETEFDVEGEDSMNSDSIIKNSKDPDERIALRNLINLRNLSSHYFTEFFPHILEAIESETLSDHAKLLAGEYAFDAIHWTGRWEMMIPLIDFSAKQHGTFASSSWLELIERVLHQFNLYNPQNNSEKDKQKERKLISILTEIREIINNDLLKSFEQTKSYFEIGEMLKSLKTIINLSSQLKKYNYIFYDLIDQSFIDMTKEIILEKLDEINEEKDWYYKEIIKNLELI